MRAYPNRSRSDRHRRTRPAPTPRPETERRPSAPPLPFRPQGNLQPCARRFYERFHDKAHRWAMLCRGDREYRDCAELLRGLAPPLRLPPLHGPAGDNDTRRLHHALPPRQQSTHRRNIYFQHPTAATNHKLPAAEGNPFFEQSCCHRHTHTGMKTGQPPPVVSKLIDRVRAIFPAPHRDHCGIVFSHNLLKRFAKNYRSHNAQAHRAA